MAALFSQAATDAGTQLVVTQAYPPDATAFGREIATLAKSKFDALFIPDASPRIALLAPALAAAGLWSTPLGQTAPGHGREVQLLIPSVGFSADLAEQSGRYLQGAAFSTPFAENGSDPAAQAFADRYQAQFGSAPNTLAAVAHDAYKLVDAASKNANTTREQVIQSLARRSNANTIALIHGLGKERIPAQPLRVMVLDDVSMVDAPTTQR
jgi:branched-chain amino acid transport system substrate-binding protein